MDVLVVLAEHAGEVVTRDELFNAVWQGQVVSDERLTHAIAELRRALEDDRDTPKYIETVPKRGYRLIGEVRLPEGIKFGNDTTRTNSVTHVIRGKLAFAIIGILTIAVAYFLSQKFFGDDDLATRSHVTASIAVLPFVALSSGEDDGYFADGLTEEILNALNQLPELQVTARTSSFFFKGQSLPVPEIAARLEVGHVVEGSVRRDGERIRITAQLIRASDGFHLWSDSYDRTLDDVFAVQEDIAENIAETLGVLLDDNARRLMRNVGIRDVEAFIAYQKGMVAFGAAHGSFNIIGELLIANAYFDRALEAAPGLTSARLARTDRAAHVIQSIAYGGRDEEYRGEAQELLAALQEEYDLAWRLSTPGNQRDILDVERTLFSNDWSRLPARMQTAMQPGGCSQMYWTANAADPFGWAEPLAKKYREKLACDPMDLSASSSLPWELIWAGDPEAALQAIEEAENKGMSDRWLEKERYLALLAAGRVNDTLAMVRTPGLESKKLRRQIQREALAGDPGLARQMAEVYWSKHDVWKQDSLIIAAVVGDRERANEFAARIDAYPGSAVWLGWIVSDCFCGAPFDLEATPNYKARIEEAGFAWPPPKPIDYPTKTW
jgi:TolB-like protein